MGEREIDKHSTQASSPWLGGGRDAPPQLSSGPSAAVGDPNGAGLIGAGAVSIARGWILGGGMHVRRGGKIGSLI